MFMEGILLRIDQRTGESIEIKNEQIHDKVMEKKIGASRYF